MKRGALALLLVAAVVHAEPPTGDVHAGVDVYMQPALGDSLLVLSPSANGHVAPLPWLKVDVSWLADVVTGATPRTYGAPDVVTKATSFSETRNNLGAGVEFDAGPAAITLGYSYGTESDYVSHLVRGGLKLDLAQHNTILAVDYSHSFDSVCDLAQPGVPLLLRQPLDRSKGCFTGLTQLYHRLTQRRYRRGLGHSDADAEHLGHFWLAPTSTSSVFQSAAPTARCA